MKLNRRHMIAGSAVLAASAGAFSFLSGNDQPGSSFLPGVTAAQAADADPAKLLVAPSIGDREPFDYRV